VAVRPCTCSYPCDRALSLSPSITARLHLPDTFACRAEQAAPVLFVDRYKTWKRREGADAGGNRCLAFMEGPDGAYGHCNCDLSPSGFGAINKRLHLCTEHLHVRYC
jgi:hypothetical protein